jgi:hypothetical protein
MLSTTIKPKKPKACKNCKAMFTPAKQFQIVCGPMCGLERARKTREAKEKAQAKIKNSQERAQYVARKEKLKKPSEWEEECRAIVQKIARLRDRHDGCISCHMGANYGGQWHGSHFRPAGNNSAVQFHLWNIHKACAQCNLFKGGNIAAYRPRLVEKIGAARVEWLEGQNQVVKGDVAYLKRFKAVMGKKLRRLEKRIKGEFA